MFFVPACRYRIEMLSANLNLIVLHVKRAIIIKDLLKDILSGSLGALVDFANVFSILEEL